VFREKIAGTTADRPQLRRLMARLAAGDAIIPPAVDRLARDTTDLLVIALEMQRAGAGIRSLAEPYPATTSARARFRGLLPCPYDGSAHDRPSVDFR
jgi:DNA invertase Pin-like site-specific DNA recombinase